MTQKRSSTDIEQRRDHVIKSATAVFLRYGYARTSMGDLAGAAHLSRPALYQVFPGKEELFSEVIRELNREAIEGYRRTLPKLRSLKTKLQRFCRDWGTHGLKLVEVHPDARDLFDMKHPAVREMYGEFIAFLVGILVEERGLSEQSAHRVMYNLVFSLSGLEAAARDVAHMEKLIGTQVDIFLRSVESSDGSADVRVI